MSYPRHLLVLALTVVLSATAAANPTNRASGSDEKTPDAEGERRKTDKRPDAGQPVSGFAPLQLTDKERDYRTAYMDAFNILSTNNTCSQFFGGVIAAIEVLNKLTGQLEKESLHNKAIGIRMSGSYATIQSARTGTSYRLFDKAVLNSDGPFLRKDTPFTARSGLSVGRFPSQSREAKVLMLLHELGHLLPGQQGGWLIPDDGGSQLLSERNTATIERQCRDQILALRDGKPGAKPLRVQWLETLAGVTFNDTRIEQ